MPYHPLDLNNDLPQELEEFVRRHIDPDLEELHYLMLVRRKDQGPKGSFQKSFAKVLWIYAEACGLILAFLGSDGRNAAMIFNLRYSSSR